MRIDLHNHTTKCNHATGTIDEYIQRAIELGVDIYGFSEHAPMNFDQYYRLSFEDMSCYEQDILTYKQIYKDDIEILLGYEVDYLKGYIDSRVIENRSVDYLIGSVHFLDKWGFDNPEFIGEYKNRDIDDIWQEYFDAIEDMAKTGYFDIVGHLDLIKVFKYLPQKDIRVIAQNALKAIKKSNMVIELNSAGLRKPIKELYPSKELLEVVYELDIPITFSSDAHSVEQVGFGYKEVIEIAKSIGYTKAVTFEQREKQLVNF
ncbi:MAG TPA: histidinol-phosphatase HisJ family protein [Campylobacterales bacterium]|jgi:histidinol-phosphatase (PHP family)|nr:histidinol-phosphatase HisJ family protein [Campylobacterales bacterium]